MNGKLAFKSNGDNASGEMTMTMNMGGAFLLKPHNSPAIRNDDWITGLLRPASHKPNIVLLLPTVPVTTE